MSNPALPMPRSFSDLIELIVERRAGSSTPSTPPIPVMVVEDDVPIRQFVERVLRGAGFATVVASDATDALAKARAMQPMPLLVTDLVMPGMGGDELARELRQLDPSLKVLYVTGYADHLFDERPMLEDGEAFLEKPFTPRGLLEAASLLLMGRTSGPQTQPQALWN